jgi:hypothetical protein
MRLTLSQENEQYGRKILQMNHRSYKEMRGSTAVQYCPACLAGGSIGQYVGSTGCIAALAILRGSTSLPWLAFALVFGFVL